MITERNGTQYSMSKPTKKKKAVSVNSLQKKVIELADLLNIIKVCLEESPEILPSETKSKIDEFVNWYAQLGE